METWFKERCLNCAWYDEKRDKHKQCWRDWPGTSCIENCKIRVRKGSPWIDAFIPIRTWLVDIPVNYFRTNEEWKKMDKQEKLDHLDALMKQQVKKAAKKGTELIVGKLDDLPEEFKTIHDFLMGPCIPWFYNHYVDYKDQIFDFFDLVKDSAHNFNVLGSCFLKLFIIESFLAKSIPEFQ